MRHETRGHLGFQDLAPPGPSDAARHTLEALARTHHQFLFALARKLCPRHFDPEDLVQEVLVKTLARLDQLPADVNHRAWMTQVMKHLFIDQLRRARTSSRPVEPVTDGESEEAPWWHALDASHVHAAMAQLPEQQRDVFERFAFRGECYDAIANALGIAKATVGTRILRARRRIRELLEQEQDR
jgi:RNA polymerase sigma-70 factor (ECF subfamily)